MSDVSEQEPSNTIGELKKAFSSEVGKAEGRVSANLLLVELMQRMTKLPF